jgi:hypothetical protein
MGKTFAGLDHQKTNSAPFGVDQKIVKRTRLSIGTADLKPNLVATALHLARPFLRGHGFRFTRFLNERRELGRGRRQ